MNRQAQVRSHTHTHTHTHTRKKYDSPWCSYKSRKQTYHNPYECTNHFRTQTLDSWKFRIKRKKETKRTFSVFFQIQLKYDPIVSRNVARVKWKKRVMKGRVSTLHLSKERRNYVLLQCCYRCVCNHSCTRALLTCISLNADVWVCSSVWSILPKIM